MFVHQEFRYNHQETCPNLQCMHPGKTASCQENNRFPANNRISPRKMFVHRQLFFAQKLIRAHKAPDHSQLLHFPHQRLSLQEPYRTSREGPHCQPHLGDRFSKSDLKDEMAKLNISLQASTPYFKGTTSTAELSVKLIRRAMNKICLYDSRRWPENLPLVLDSLNNSLL